MEYFQKIVFKYAILPFMIILLGLAACSKGEDEKKENATCYLSDEFKSYTVFNEGSYWIFCNQDSIMDTITLTDSKFYIDNYPNGYPSEKYQKVLSSSRIQEIGEPFFGVCEDIDDTNCRNYNRLGGGFTRSLVFFCACEEGTRIENLTYVNTDSATINGVLYNEVKFFESDTTSFYQYTHRFLLYAKDIGLIKYKDYKGNTWEIIAYNIE